MKRHTLLSASLIILALLVTQATLAAKLYKWVDKDGNISYQGSPPPEGSTLIKEEDISSPATANTDNSTQPDITVTVYTIDNCEACELLLLRLQNWNITAQELSLQNRDVQQRILQISDSLSAPTLFIGDKLVSNLSSSNLAAEFQQAGFQIEGTNTSSSDASQDGNQ